MPFRVSLVGLIVLVVAYSGCLGGSPETCVPLEGDQGDRDPDRPAVNLLTEPTGPGGDGTGWPILVDCTSDASPLAAYRFELDAADGRTIVVAPNGTWSSPLHFFGPTADTQEGDTVQAQRENPGNEGDPTYRITFRDEDDNGVLDAGDRIVIGYDAGSAGTTVFDSPFEGGLYRLSVFQVDGDQSLGEVRRTFESPVTG